MRKTLIAIAVAACIAGCDSRFWLKDAGQEETGNTKQEAPAPPPLRIGDFVHVNSKTVACRSRDTLIQLQEFLGKDLAAFDSLWADSLASGECTNLLPRTRLEISSHGEAIADGFYQTRCVCPQGKTVCFVTFNKFLIPDEPPVSQPELTPVQERQAIDHIKKHWRAYNGETAEQIKAAQVAHFVPRSWDAGRMDGKTVVTLGWVMHKSDKDEDQYSLQLEISDDGSAQVNPPYAKVMALGSAAFALSLIQDEVNDEVPGANRSYLRNIANYSFVATPKGNLGDLLAAGKCSVRNPTHVFYLSDTDAREQDEAFYLKISVDCEGTGNIYFTHNGLVILQMKKGSTEWHPLSFFATRIWDHAPRDWFSGEEPVEHKVFGLVHKYLQGTSYSRVDADNICKFIEMRNTGDYSGPGFDEEWIAANVDLLMRIHKTYRVSSLSMMEFIRHSGPMALTMSDDGILHMAECCLGPEPIDGRAGNSKE